MKHFIKIIENTEEARDEEGYLCGSVIYEISKEELKALQDGKCLSTEINNEYRIFIVLEE